MNIGQAAEKTGISTDTIRYYIKRGLLEEPNRTRADYRQFDERALVRIRFILNAKAVGFSLGEIRQLVKMIDDPNAECADMKARIAAKLADIDERMKALRSVRKTLAGLADSCNERPQIEDCPIVRTLETEKERKRK